MSHHDHVIYLDTDAGRRRYVAHVPPAAPDRERPAVVMLDGRGGTPWTAMKSTLWSAKSDAEDFVVLYPEALRLQPHGPQHFLDNPQMWNAGAGASDAERVGVDDAAFLRQVILDARARFALHPRRIFVAGFSNGAAMAYRMAMESSDLVAAIAPVAGHCRIAGAAPARPVPMVSLFGKRDPLSPFEGGPVDLPWGQREDRPPARRSVVDWALLHGLGAEPTAVQEEPGLTIERFGPDQSGMEVVFYAVHELGHVWPGGHRLLPEALVGATSGRINATDIIWDFFVRHPLP